MKTIQEYALALVADGAESAIEDDMNEDGEVADEHHETAREFAYLIVRVVRERPREIIELVASLDA